MDIRKFFGTQPVSKKPAAPPTTSTKSKEITGNKLTSDHKKNSSAAKSTTNNTQDKKTVDDKHKTKSDSKKWSTSSSDKSDKTKKTENRDKNSSSSSKVEKKHEDKSKDKPEDPVIIDEDSDDVDLIEDSQKGSKKKTYLKRDKSSSHNSKTKQFEKEKEEPEKEESSERKKSRKLSITDDDSDFEIESVKSDNEEELSRKTKSAHKRRSSTSNSKTKKESGSSKEKSKHPTSPRKQKSNASGDKKEDAPKPRKRKQISSDDASEPETKAISDESEDEEEIISSRRNRHSKGSKKAAKKSHRLFESDSDEDPVPKEKPKGRKKKKDSVVFVNDSDEEKPQTALDKFVIHNATPKPTESKKKDEKKEVKGTPVSITDFFGSGAVSRSAKTSTSSAKRKLGEEKKAECLTFEEELHDDEDFLKTLDQLDGPDAKKVKYNEPELEPMIFNSEEKPVTTPTSTAQGSLASKLSSKMKALKETSDNKTVDTDTKQEARGQSKSPTKPPSPVKADSHKMKNTSAQKKGKVYTMEVTRPKPPSVVVSPAKPKEKEDTTPPKKDKVVKKDNSTPSGKDDDGFGGPKGIAGYNAFKNRGGPLALGSKEIPEGAENCLESLTFVITGVLDSIERDEAKTLVERYGGKVTGSVSRKTSYVVVGREPGESKLAKARDLKVKQLDEDGLLDLIRTQPGKKSKYEIQAEEQMKKEAAVKKEAAKSESVAKKLQSFKSDKVPPAAGAPDKKSSLFTQIKDADDVKPSPASPNTSAKLLGQSQPSQSQQKSDVKTADGGEAESLMWVDKHKPTSLKQIIGQHGDKSNANKLLAWLKNWHQNIIVKGLKSSSGNFFNKGDGAGCRAALLSGPPGIGKTTTATLVCKELGFSYVELNASDKRSKKSLKQDVAESLNNRTLVDYMGVQQSDVSGQSHCIIMDEVDGMAGSEDMGGLQELVLLIKSTKIPIITICNDRNSMKMRTLSNYCLDLRFSKPRMEQIKGAMMSIAFKEGIKIPAPALQEIIQASNQDIRQVIHNLSMWSAGEKNMTFDQVKVDAQKAQKDIKLGPFDVVRKVFVNDEETRKMTINDKSDLFFNDYSFGPLFVHENYPVIQPQLAKGSQSRHMSCLARTIDSICDGDLVEKLVRKEGHWSMLPLQAMYSSVIPGEVMRGSFPQMAVFPQWLGKFSSTRKSDRILQELSTHMGLEICSDKRGLTLDYLPALRTKLTGPLVAEGAEGVADVIKVMDDYDIVREDFDNILAVTQFPGGPDPMSKLESKTKAAFTRQYNKQIHMTPYSTGVDGVKKRKPRGAPMDESLFATEDGEGAIMEESEEEEVVIQTVKPKKAPAKKAAAKGSTAGKGKGQGKGRGKK